MIVRSIKELEAEWLRLERSKKLSDGLISIGGFGIGVNGFIALVSSAASATGIGAIPGDLLFEIYTGIMALYLLGIAVRVRASPGTVMKIFVYMALDAVTDILPVFGGLLDFTFRFPRMTARAIQKEIERTYWVEKSWSEVKAAGDYHRYWEEARTQKKSRVVFLGDEASGVWARGHAS
jgi:hypothetical protein